jgi:hypothetical protein
VEPANSTSCSLYNATDAAEMSGEWEGVDTSSLWDNEEDDDVLVPVSWVLPTNTSVDYGMATSILSGTVPLRQSFVSGNGSCLPCFVAHSVYLFAKCHSTVLFYN